MAVSALLTALANPSTHAAALSLIQLASSTMRIIDSLSDPEMSDLDKSMAWQGVKDHMAEADLLLDKAIKAHPAWHPSPSSEPQELV